jgi:hypothetical protein
MLESVKLVAFIATTDAVDPIELLTQINLDDVVGAFGFRNPLLASVLRALCRRPARKFAAQLLAFDAAVARIGLAASARELQRLHVRELIVTGSEHVPRVGPVVALSNHPSMTDTLCLFAALDRSDLKVIALRRPFLQALPNLAQRLFFIGDDRAARLGVVRGMGRHLRRGGAALTFPAGRTEPDPDVYPGALASLQTWSDSVGAFLRLAPETVVLPVAVRGVVWKRTAHHPLICLRNSYDQRELLANALQLLSQLVFDLRPVRVHVHFGRPITSRRLGSLHPSVVHRAVLAEMTDLLAERTRA